MDIARKGIIWEHPSIAAIDSIGGVVSGSVGCVVSGGVIVMIAVVVHDVIFIVVVSVVHLLDELESFV